MSVQTLGFCPKCRQNVSLVKKELDVCLLIILFAFTGGIGGIIYLIIWALQPSDHCVLCGSRTMPLTTASGTSSISSGSSSSSNQPVYSASVAPAKSQVYSTPSQSAPSNMNSATQFQPNVQYQEKKEVEKKYCPYCGNELQTKSRFCGVCGSTIQ